MKNPLSRRQGFALLYAVLVSSLLLAIGTTIVSTTLKNLEFSSTGRESQFSFYAADSAAECALYYDKIKGAFPTSTPAVNFVWQNIDCGGGSAAMSAGNLVGTPTATAATTTFKIINAPTIGTAPGLCATVVISKSQSNPSDPATLVTTIDSRGYDTCDVNNLRRTERGLLINY